MLYLPQVHQHFLHHPKHLHLLAQHSLECHILLTPVLAPNIDYDVRTGTKTQRYASAFENWLKLLRRLKTNSVREQEVHSCLQIHRTLLDWAEYVWYPNSLHILAMLKHEEQHPNMPWQQVWQDYLLNQLES